MHDSIHVLIAKPGLDSRDRGDVAGRALRDAGTEVTDTGLRHRLAEPRGERNTTDAIVTAGGIILDGDAAHLKKQGVAAMYQPGASLDEMVSYTGSSVMQTA